jgi:DNA-3-methyladenine glycosylase
MRLERDFFNRDVLAVAPELLGKYLVRKKGKKILAAKITEVEAYRGTEDLACHASKGLTPRTKVLFGPPGQTYVYLIYGMYYCLNFVTNKEGYPAAVLIRAIEMPGGNGPGKLCRLLDISREHNNLAPENSLVWVEDRGDYVVRKQIQTSKRIGVDYAGAWKDKLWRFVLI